VRGWPASHGAGSATWSAAPSITSLPQGSGPAPDGSGHLVALQQAPAYQQRTVAPAAVLLARATADDKFGQALAAWYEQARHHPAASTVTNTVSGSTQYGPMSQGHDSSGLTFATTPRHPTPHQTRKRERARPTCRNREHHRCTAGLAEAASTRPAAAQVRTGSDQAAKLELLFPPDRRRQARDRPSLEYRPALHRRGAGAAVCW
jgi:hypothetical protein